MTSDYIEFRGAQFEQFYKALLAAYTYSSLQSMLMFRLEEELNVLAGDALRPFGDVVYDLINWANKQGRARDLLLGARQSNPGNPTLLAFAQQFGLAPGGTPARPALEAMIKQTNSFLDVALWREKLGLIEGQVCRVELPDTTGTGFLLGSSVVMTNYHVVESLIGDSAASDKMVLRFDYKRMGDTVVNPGKEYRPVEGKGWLADYAEYSPVDKQPQPKSGPPEADKLDYALLQVDGTPGDEPLLTAPGQTTITRGWIEIPKKAYDFKPKTPLFIVQHPKGEPLKLALENEAVISLEGKGRRVHYCTNTETGSSGSPVFDQNWNLVALHHAGEPNWVPHYNEGIPISLILAQLTARGYDSLLGKQEL